MAKGKRIFGLVNCSDSSHPFESVFRRHFIDLYPLDSQKKTVGSLQCGYQAYPYSIMYRGGHTSKESFSIPEERGSKFDRITILGSDQLLLIEITRTTQFETSIKREK